jgi:hypothetical protein
MSREYEYDDDDDDDEMVDERGYDLETKGYTGPDNYPYHDSDFDEPSDDSDSD